MKLWYSLLMCICALFVVRLFYVQVIRHDYYKSSAAAAQYKEYKIPAERGVIEAHNGSGVVPLVLNEKKYTLFADPQFITDKHKAALAVSGVIGGKVDDLTHKLDTKSRYVILAKKLDKSTKDKLDALNQKGIGTRSETYRIYPQGVLAGQLLGFVNDEGVASYGLEQALNSELQGVPGQLKAITDASGVPLVANKDNISIEPKNGARVTLTVDVAMQQRLEDILKSGLDDAKSKSGSALILDANTGAVVAMANYPSYNPAEFYKVEDRSLFTNAVVSQPLEIGSIMKPLTAAAALDQGVIGKNWTYNDPGTITIDGAKISNVHDSGGVTSLFQVLQFSLNTGATKILMQMGGGKLNDQARKAWYNYLTNHYKFGSKTGIEQGYEAEGSVPAPTDVSGINIQYANSSFGQGINTTLLQVGAAFGSIINGGKYYKPHLVEATTVDGVKKFKAPELVDGNVVKPEVSDTLVEFMNGIIASVNKPAVRAGYSVGGKTGTAQVANPKGGYYEDRITGTYLGFVGGDKPQYVVVVRVNDPGIGGFAGQRAAAPIFATISNSLIDNFNVTPKAQ